MKLVQENVKFQNQTLNETIQHIRNKNDITEAYLNSKDKNKKRNMTRLTLFDSAFGRTDTLVYRFQKHNLVTSRNY